MHFTKEIMGTGSLAIPLAIQRVGLLIGCIGLPLVGLLTLTSMHMILQCAQELSTLAGTSYMSYADVAEFTCKYSGSERLHSWSNFFR